MDVSASRRSFSKLVELVIPAPGVIWSILSEFNEKALWVRGLVIEQAVSDKTLSNNIGSFNVELSDISSGVYFIKLDSNEKIFYKKISIQ